MMKKILLNSANTIKKIHIVFLLCIFQLSFSQIQSTAAGGNWSATSTWVGGVVPATTQDVEIVPGSTVTVAATIARTGVTNINGTLTINSSINFATSSIINNNGVFNVNGTLQLNSGAVVNNNSPVYGNTSSLNYNAIVGNVGLEWTGGNSNDFIVGQGIPQNVVFLSGSDVKLNNARGLAGNLEIRAGAKLTLSSVQGEDLFLKGNILAPGNFITNQRTLVFCRSTTSAYQTVSSINPIDYIFLNSPANSSFVQLASNITIASPSGGSAIKYANSTDRLHLNGRTLTLGTPGVSNIIEGSGSFIGNSSSSLVLLGLGSIGDLKFLAGNEILSNLTVNRESNTLAANLVSPLTINGNLTLTNGHINTFKRLILGVNINVSPVAGSQNSFIIASGSNGGSIRKLITPASNQNVDFTFPYGTVSTTNNYEFTPLNLAFKATVNTNGSIESSVYNSKHFSNDAETNYINRYWRIIQNNVVNPRYKIATNYLASDVNPLITNETKLKASIYRGEISDWTQQGSVAGRNITINSVVGLASGNFHDITAVEKVKKREINVRGNGITITTGDTSPQLFDNTDFGTTTINNTITKTFRIENTGDNLLSISNVMIQNTNNTLASPFFVKILPVTNTFSLDGLEFIDIQISFSANAAGTYLGKVIIINNDPNEDNYNFQIKATVSDNVPCNSFNIVAMQGFEMIPSQPELSYTVYDTDENYPSVIAGGNAFHLTTNVSKFDDKQSFQVFNANSTIEFSSVNTSTLADAEFSFNLAALGYFSGRGVGTNDTVEVFVSNDDGATYYSQLIIRGGNNATPNSTWTFASGSTNVPYSTSGPLTLVAENGAGTATSINRKLGTIKITGLPLVTQLKIKIVAISTSDYNIWTFDNFILLDNTGNKIWNGNNWTGINNNPPLINEKAIFNGDYDTVSKGNITACECEVKNGKTLTINDNNFIDIHNNIVNNGSIIVESGGNLIQRNPSGTFTGNDMLVKRNANFYALSDYNYWGSPIINRNLYSFSPKTPANRIFIYNEANDYFISTGLNSSSTFTPGKGYAFKAPQQQENSTAAPAFPYVWEGKFSGAPHNGNISINLTRTVTASHSDAGYNLVSNPYPSNLDFDKLYADNISDIYQSAWFWTNSAYTANQQGSSYGTYGVNNYAIYNGTGGVSATTFPTSPPTSTPNKDIRVGQGFIVKAKNNNVALDFKNTQRNASTTSVFFNKGTEASTKDRFWVELVSPTLVKNTILIGYVENATNSFEWDFDSPVLTIGSDAFYSILGTEKLGIQGKQYPLQDSDVISLGTKQYQPGNYTFKLTQKEGIFANGKAIYLHDKLTGKYTNLQQESYTFDAQKGTTENRFEIVYVTQTQTVLGTAEINKNEVLVYRNFDDFVILSKSKKIEAVEMYDASGKLILTKKSNENEVRISSATLQNAVYILKITSGGKTFTKKIIK